MGCAHSPAVKSSITVASRALVLHLSTFYMWVMVGSIAYRALVNYYCIINYVTNTKPRKVQRRLYAKTSVLSLDWCQRRCKVSSIAEQRCDTV